MNKQLLTSMFARSMFTSKKEAGIAIQELTGLNIFSMWRNFEESSNAFMDIQSSLIKEEKLSKDKAVSKGCLLLFSQLPD